MRPSTFLLTELAGVLLLVGSCVVFPARGGSDFVGIPAPAIIGLALGVLLMLAGLAPYMRGGGGPPH